MSDRCPICQRDGIELTSHHLIPKTCQDNAWFQKRYSLEEMKNMTIDVCRLCHDKIHYCEKEKVLAREYNSLEKILEHPEIKKFIPWANKQKF